MMATTTATNNYNLGYFVIISTRLKRSRVLVFPNKSYRFAARSLPSPSSLLKFPLLGSQKYVLFTHVRWAVGSQ